MKAQLTVWNFWLWWVVASNLGLLVGSVLGVLPFVLLQLSQGTAAFQAVTGMFIGGGIALGQWFVLRRQLPLSAGWILAGLVGLGIADTIGAAFCICLAGFIYLIITAGWQTLILQKRVRGAWLWMLAGLVGMVLGGSFGEFYHDAPWLPLVYVSVASGVTGFAMMLLARLKR